jgi:dTDP-4-dehydrorhamnose 3,5-epimerase
MTFREMRLTGVWLIDCEAFADDRGEFLVAWQREAFSSRGLETAIAQCSIARSRRRGTIRGLHFQREPYAEVKVIRAIRGTVFDVVVDLRPDSRTFCQWIGTELSAANRRMVYVPRGFAHGYQTLTDDAEVFYTVSTPYSPTHQAGARWDDPAFAITWPLGAPTLISTRDAAHPDFDRSTVAL